MRPENPEQYTDNSDFGGPPYFANIGRYDTDEDTMIQLQYASSFPVSIKNPGQAIYAEALMNPSISAVICHGPCGSGRKYKQCCGK